MFKQIEFRGEQRGKGDSQVAEEGETEGKRELLSAQLLFSLYGKVLIAHLPNER